MKKILCLVLATVMLFTAVSTGVTASAAGVEVSSERPKSVSDVIDPIYTAYNSIFANSINELGYESVNNNTKKIVPDSPFLGAGSLGINEITFSDFIAKNADDTMFGVDYDFLYSKDNSTFLWNYLDYKLLPDLESAVSEILGGKANEFRSEWKNMNVGRTYTLHDAEMYLAKINNKKTTSCTCKTRYDACAAVLAGYDYAYENKTADQTLFAGIRENKVYIINPFTHREEIHYEYAFKLEKGDFGLMRANSNNQLVKVIKAVWGDGAIYATPKKASENALKFVNFIGNLVNDEFDEKKSDYNPFANKVRVTRDEFFEEVVVTSGLADILQAKWCNAKGFDVTRIMSALGVNVDPETILDSELTKGNKMGARILSDMYIDFFADPVGYVTRLVQLFCKNYDAYYSKPINELFAVKFRAVEELSRKSNADKLTSYTGTELDSVHGLMGFLADCAYIMDGNLSKARFTFAPLPANRFATAKDTNELYVYVLCYLELNRIYNDNAAMITAFIDDSIETFEKLYFPADAEKRLDDIKAVEIVFNSMFNGQLTLNEIFTTHVGLFTMNTIDNFSNNFFYSIKQAIANFFQNFLIAIDKIMNSLFGWLA